MVDPVYLQNVEGFIDIFRLFKTLGRPAQDLKVHDLLAIKEKNNFYAAIYTGAGMAITSNINEGIRVFHLGRLHKVVMIRRVL